MKNMKLSHWIFIGSALWWITEIVASQNQSNTSSSSLQSLYSSMGAVDNALPTFGILGPPYLPATPIYGIVAGFILRRYGK